MIVCTRTVDSIARRAFSSNDVAISSVEAMIAQFSIDPTLSTPAKEAYIVSDSDIKNSKMLNKFLTSAATKHPDVKIVYLVRASKSNVNEGNGIDKVLIRTRPELLAEAVNNLVESIEAKAPINSSAIEAPTAIPEWKPAELFTPVEEIIEHKDEVTAFVPNIEELVLPDFTPEEPEPESSKGSELVTQIKQCQKVSDIAVLTRELSSAKIIKDIVKENQQYTSIEERLKGIKEKIYSVFIDPSVKSTGDKLDRVKALLYDKDYYKSKNNTVIEQRVEEVINVIIEQTKSLLDDRLKQLDKAILNVGITVGEVDYTRLAGITEERSNLLIELTLLDKQIREIFVGTDELATTVAGEIAEDSANLTGSPLVDARLRLNHESIVSDKSLDTIVKILSTCEKTDDEFKGALRDISIMYKKLNKLMDLDKESIASLTQIIQYLKANNVEDTIVAETLIKKSLRLFVAKEGSGRTVVPYVLSKLKSRENANVLYVDLTGTTKLTEFGESFYTIEDWYNNRYEKEFCAVVGEVGSSPESVQRLMVALTRAADYYRVINVVIDPEQEELLHIIAPDVLAVNYIVDPNIGTLNFFKDFIKNTQYDNVAQRVIINKCDVQIRPVIERLDLMENLDVHVAKIPYIPAIVDCSLYKVIPSQVDTIVEGFREVSKVC